VLLRSISGACSSRSISISACSSRSIAKHILRIFLVAIVPSSNYDSPRGHKHPNARWPRNFAKVGLTSLQKLGESSSSITGQVIKEDMVCDVL
jgi:hypothetical protein